LWYRPVLEECKTLARKQGKEEKVWSLDQVAELLPSKNEALNSKHQKHQKNYIVNIEETILWFTKVFFFKTLGAFTSAHSEMHHGIRHRKTSSCLCLCHRWHRPYNSLKNT
jgi:hypothetical protein